MKRKKIKQILVNYYSVAGADLILRGERKPKYEVIVELHKKHNIPFDVWLDIKSYIENDTKKDSCSTTTN
jgi:hypothetical protein